MKKYHRLINFTSGTTSVKECVKMWIHKKDHKDYRGMYHSRICDFFDVKYAFSYTAGRMALYSILKSLGVQTGDEVVIQGYTCCVVPKAIMYVGAIPIYADICKENYNMTYSSFEKCITDKTKVVVVQHTFGIPCKDIELIKELCHKKNIYLIEDCAHTFGGEYQGRKLGTIGDVAFFSTDHTKYISTSIGGFAITNNSEIGVKLAANYRTIAEMSSKEINAVVFQFSATNFFQNKYVCWLMERNRYFKACRTLFWILFDKLGLVFYMNDYSNVELPIYTFPSKLSNVQAYIGISQIKQIEKNIENRKAITEQYKDNLKGLYKFEQTADALLRFPILVNRPEEYIEVMKDFVRIERWFHPVLQGVGDKELINFGYIEGECPIAEEVAKHMINLPIHFKIHSGEVEVLCDKIQELYKTNGYEW